MKSTLRPIITFPVAGLVSGICSGLSSIVSPLGFLSPGVIFGIAISYAIHTTLKPLSFAQRCSLVGGSTFAHMIAIVVSLLSVRLPGFDNGFVSGALSGAIAGMAGGLGFATSLVVVVQELRSASTVLAVTLAGTVFGSLFIIVGVYIADYTAAGYPISYIVSFPLWQVGVASVIPVFHVRRHTT